jgi:polyisoprenoid-binding protein YceI
MKMLFAALVILSVNAIAGVDMAKSEFKWTGKKIAGPHYGVAPLKSATLVEEKGFVTGGEFVIDMTKIDVQDLQGEWKGKLEGHLKSADFFEVDKYPTATLKIKSVKGKTVSADLTIKGITKPVSFDTKKEGAVYSGQLVFDRTQFNVKYNSGSFFDVKALGDKLIDDKVTVDFKVTQN